MSAVLLVKALACWMNCRSRSLQCMHAVITLMAGHSLSLAGHEVSAALTQGPVYSLEVSGGACTEDARTGRVTCTQPAIMLSKAAGGCNFAYTGPSVVQACRPGAFPPASACGAGLIGRHVPAYGA